MTATKAPQRKSRPRLVLHFSDEPGDVPANVWEELVMTAREDDPSGKAGDPHEVARYLAHSRFVSWAGDRGRDRRDREAEAAAKAKAIDDVAHLAECDDEAALLRRACEINPGLRSVLGLEIEEDAT